MRPFRIYLVTGAPAQGGSASMTRAIAAAAAALPPGALAVQVRDRTASARELSDRVRRVMEAVEGTGTPVLVNDRLDIAITTGADGVHLPGNGIPPGLVRRCFGGLVGVSVHSAAEVAALDPADADFATFGPVFDTPSKRAFGPPQGVDRLKSAVAASRVPVYAIGGIDADTAASLKDVGIAGVAVIRAVLDAADAGGAARRLWEAVAGLR